jgi:hypothetical protein
MKTGDKLQRVTAAIAAVAVSFSIVWGISGYAYPDVASGPLRQLAKESVVPAGLPATCKGCVPG